MLVFYRISCFSSSLVISMAFSGCIGLRVPSDRYQKVEVSAEFHATEPYSKACSSQSSGCDLGEEEPPKEIPWPMFHPLPTRPVFGGEGL